MRAKLALVAAIAAVALVGCYHDKFGMNTTTREEYVLPPDDPRYNLPDTATYRPKPQPKEQETLMNRGGGGRGSGNGIGGF